MLIHPTAIVALVLYLIIGQLTVSERYKTQRKLLGERARRKLSLFRSRYHATLELRPHPASSDATATEAYPVALIETTATPLVGATPPTPVPLEDYVEVVVPEVTHYERPSPVPSREFVINSQYRGPFHWRDLLNYRVFETLSLISFSVWLPSIAIPFVAKLLLRSNTLPEIEPFIDELPEQLPPKAIQIQTSTPDPHAPLEPVFSPAPPKSSPFWLASQKRLQDQPSSPSPLFLRLLDLPTLENEFQKKISPLPSPADSGYGTTLPDTKSDASPLTSDNSFAATPEHPANPLPSACAELTPVDCSNDTNTTVDNFTEDGVAPGPDSELEDDDDGSITVTNSTANLASLITRPVPISAEELAAKLEPVADTLTKEVTSIPDRPVEEPSLALTTVDDSTEDLSSHNDPSLSNDEPAVDLENANHEIVIEEPSVGTHYPPEPYSDATPAAVRSAPAEKVSPRTCLESITEEDEEPSEDDLEDVEPWTPDYEIPAVIVSPPSDVDPEDFPPQFDSEDEQEGIIGYDSRYLNCGGGYEGPESDYGYELENAGSYSNESVTEVSEYASDRSDDLVIVVGEDSPSSPTTLSDPWRSPITTSGMLWSDDDDSDLGPLPFSEKIPHVEVFDAPDTDTFEKVEIAWVGDRTRDQDSPAEEGLLDDVGAPVEALGVEELVVDTAPEPTEELQPVLPETPVQEVVEPTPAPTASAPSPVKKEDRGERKSRPEYFHCCDLFKSHGRPASWKTWEMKRACIPTKTSLQESHFVRPTDEDGETPTTRIAIDNLDTRGFRISNGVTSYGRLTETMGFFSTEYFRCWKGRMINGVECTNVGYATVDFESIDEAIRMFGELQGRRLRGNMWHWRLQFVDPEDETHGGRKVIRTGLVPDSVKQALAAELEASTRRNEGSSHSDETAVPTRAPMRVRPQLGNAGRSLLAGAVANVVRDRTRPEEQPTRSSTRAPPRRPYRS